MAKDEKVSAEAVVRDIRRQTRKKYSAEEKIRIVLEGLHGEDSIAELCRREGIAPNMYYKWSKEFLEAGKARLTGDTKRCTSSKPLGHKGYFAKKHFSPILAHLFKRTRVPAG